MIEVSYNTKSPFGNALSTGSQRFRDEGAFMEWLKEQLRVTSWPVIITSIKRG